jgi:hypothetical protein
MQSLRHGDVGAQVVRGNREEAAAAAVQGGGRAGGDAGLGLRAGFIGRGGLGFGKLG